MPIMRDVKILDTPLEPILESSLNIRQACIFFFNICLIANATSGLWKSCLSI